VPAPSSSVNANVSHFPRPVRYGLAAIGGATGGEHRAFVVGEPQSVERGLRVAVVGNSHYSRDQLGWVQVDRFEPAALLGRTLAFAMPALTAKQ